MQHHAKGQLSVKIEWAFTTLVIIVAWFALVLQFSISIPLLMAKGCSLCSAFVQILSYFTILSNLLMVVCLSAILLAAKSRLGGFFKKPAVLTAVALYITIVAIIYNIILRNIWNPQGLPRLADELLHVVNPVLFIIYWFVFVNKAELQYRNIWPWLWYPLLYFIYSLVRGAISHQYPYPFLDAAQFGYAHVLLNAVILFAVIWALGAVYIFIGQKIAKK